MRTGWLLLFAFFAAADATSQTSIVITGIVSDPEGAPFANAFVQLTARGASSPVANAVSGADGRYTTRTSFAKRSCMLLAPAGRAK